MDQNWDDDNTDQSWGNGSHGNTSNHNSSGPSRSNGNNDQWNSNAQGGNNENRRNNNDWGSNPREGNNQGNRNNGNRGGDRRGNDDWGSESRGNNSRCPDSWNYNNDNQRKDDWGSNSRGGQSNNSRQQNTTNNRGNNDSWGKNDNSGWGNDQNNDNRGTKRAPDNNDEEWKCDCGMSNFASRFSCRSCKTKKPGGGSDAKRQRPGDWSCDCGFSNFSSRSECKSCEKPKPENAANDCGGNGDNGDNLDADGNPRPERYTRKEEDVAELYAFKDVASNLAAFDNIPVEVSGTDAPAPCTSFSDCGLNQFIMKAIAKCGYEKALPIQRYAMPVVMAKRDIMARADTGSGKTAAFLLPIIHNFLTDGIAAESGKPCALVIAPTRELAQQIYNEGRKFTNGSVIRMCLVYGGEDKRRQRNELMNGCHILVATPGRLKDFMQNGVITLDNLRCVVLDEGDRLLDMGFIDDIRAIIRHQSAPSPDDVQMLMFSATFSVSVRELAAEFLNDSIFIRVGIERSSMVQQTIYQVSKREKRKKLMELLEESDPSGTIVFVETKKAADQLATYLSCSKVTSTSIHGDRTQQQREEALREFKYNKRKVLIATQVAARGLDMPDVNHVINYEMPRDIDEYIHRIGRTGRVGRQGRSSSFYDPEQNTNLMNDLVDCLRNAKQVVPEFLGGEGAADDGGAMDYDNNTSAGASDTLNAVSYVEEDNWD